MKHISIYVIVLLIVISIVIGYFIFGFSREGKENSGNEEIINPSEKVPPENNVLAPLCATAKETYIAVKVEAGCNDLSKVED